MIPERIQLLPGRIHRDESAIPSLSVPSEMRFTLLLSHKMFLRTDGKSEMSGELLENTLCEIERKAPSVALTEPMELLMKLQLVNDAVAFVR